MEQTGRCTGHCCHSFSINLSPAQLLFEAAKPDSDVTKERDVNLLSTMLIYHGQFQTNPLLKTKGESWAKKALYIGLRGDEDAKPDNQKMNGEHHYYRDSRGQHWYGCRHIQLNGDCGIYETRPEMCRKYPNGTSCGFEDCTMSPEEQKKVNDEYWGGGKQAQLISVDSLAKKKKEKADAIVDEKANPDRDGSARGGRQRKRRR